MSDISDLSQFRQGSTGRWNDVPGDVGLLAPNLIRLLNDASNAVESDASAARSCLAQVLARLQSVCPSDDLRPISPPSRGGLAPWQENRAKSYIDANLDQLIRVTDLASTSRLSVRYFSIAFKQSFGLSPNMFILVRRIEHAKILMSSPGQTLADIALACGFCDQAHFCRRFRRITGRTPTAWRREHLGNSSAGIASGTNLSVDPGRDFARPALVEAKSDAAPAGVSQ